MRTGGGKMLVVIATAGMSMLECFLVVISGGVLNFMLICSYDHTKSGKRLHLMRGYLNTAVISS